MSIRTLRVSLVLAFTCVIVPALAHAGWSTDPVQVHASTAHIPQVSAADDGHSGAIVVWQEDNATGGALRAQHLLATGDVDPSWSAPVSMSTGDVKRDALGAVPDAAGGAFVWWLEGTSIYLTHVSASGVLSNGWPARGRMVGTLIESNHRPTVLADGSGGVYIAWLSQLVTMPITTTVRVLHLGPENDARNGWPSGGRGIGSAMSVPSFIQSFDVATAPNGGLWVVMATAVLADTGGYEPGEVRVRKLGSSGLSAIDWPSVGVTVAPFNGYTMFVAGGGWRPAPAMRFVTITGSQDGGAYVLHSDLQWSDESHSWLEITGPMLHTVGPTAQVSAWPGVARSEPFASWSPSYEGGLAAASLRLIPDARGGVWLGSPRFNNHGDLYAFSYLAGPASAASASGWSGLRGLELVSCSGGGLSIASFNAAGPYGPYDPDAYISASLVPSAVSYSEVHPEPVLYWYGDVGLAATQDGGAIFVWSQSRERSGLYAIRLNPAGQVTDVQPEAFQPRLRAHFARGRGVLAQVTLPGALEADLALLDVQGRVESTVRATSNSTLEAAFPGTAALSPGVYFVRASGAGQQLTRRVVVLR